MIYRTLFPLALALVLAVPGESAGAAATAWVGDSHAAARLITATEATGSALELDAGLQIRLAPGWHTYWRNPGDAGIPPSIDWKGSANLAGAAVSWPVPQRFSLDGLETQGYERGVVLPLALTLAHRGRTLSLRAQADYAACSIICVPYHATLSLTLPPGRGTPAPQAALIAAAHARVPADLKAAGLKLTGAVIEAAPGGSVLAIRIASTGPPLRRPDVFVEGVTHGSPSRPAVTLADAGHVATLRVPIRGASAAALAEARLRLTIVDGTRSAETEVAPQIGELPAMAAGK